MRARDEGSHRAIGVVEGCHGHDASSGRSRPILRDRQRQPYSRYPDLVDSGPGPAAVIHF
jgi:hypothetical protein